MDVDFQAEMRQKLDDQARQLQSMALDVQDIRARQTPRTDIEAMLATRVSTEAYLGFKADVSQRLDKLERAPDAERANTRANVSIAIAFGGFLLTLIVVLAPHFH